MQEKIYTIKVNEAFSEATLCPICQIYETAQKNELDLILGASMMEPDIRIKTNHLGFCEDHFEKLFQNGNRLSLALILESHLNEVNENLYNKSKKLLSKSYDIKKQSQYLKKLKDSCYLCERIDSYMEKIYETIFYLYKNDPAFKEKMDNIKYICHKHTLALMERASGNLPKNSIEPFFDKINEKNKEYLSTLVEDVKWFCKKFDYRYKDEDWKNSKDAIERAILNLSSKKPNK